MTLSQKQKFISKSEYVKGLQCTKSLWFSKNLKDFQYPLDDKKESQFEVGNEINNLARKCFSDGVGSVDNYYDITKSVIATNDLIKQNKQIIFEATAQIESDGSHARIDILQKSQDSDKWDLIEVKGSTSVKESHLNDLAFQYHVFVKAGYKIDKCFVMILNGEYILNGTLEVNKLFKLEDVTETILKRQTTVESFKNEFLDVLKSEVDPKIKIGAHCFEKKNCHYECDYRPHCFADIPKYSIFDIYTKKKAEEVINTINSYDIKDLTPDVFPSGAKVIDINCYQENKTHIDKDKINKWLSKLKYPLYFLDYETFNPAIPIFNNSRAYQQIPFQFSLHIQREEGGDLQHFEFLHKERSDPRESFGTKLIELCGKEGSIICYNQSFEKGRNDDLARDFPHLSESLKQINARIVDLIEPFRGRFIYSPKQQSSYSIKKVLPAFTKLDYSDMDVANGSQAMDLYFSFIKGEKLDETKMFQDLLNYCKLDTYAMVELLNLLIEIR